MKKVKMSQENSQGSAGRSQKKRTGSQQGSSSIGKLQSPSLPRVVENVKGKQEKASTTGIQDVDNHAKKASTPRYQALMSQREAVLAKFGLPPEKEKTEKKNLKNPEDEKNGTPKSLIISATTTPRSIMRGSSKNGKKVKHRMRKSVRYAANVCSPEPVVAVKIVKKTKNVQTVATAAVVEEDSSSDDDEWEKLIGSDSDYSNCTDEEMELEPEDFEARTKVFAKRQKRRCNLKIYELLNDFYITAFTSLAKMKNVLPEAEFGIGHKFGTQVPVFLEERALEYVTEVSRKIIFYMQKNALEGAVFHVMVEDEKGIPVTQQRVVFRPTGYFSLHVQKVDYSDALQVLKFLQKAERQLGMILSHLMESSVNERLECPWYCHWAISFGLKKEYVTAYKEEGHNHMGPFLGDPHADYFPWKKRPRYSQAVKNGYIIPKKDGMIKPGTVNKILESRKSAAESTAEILKRLSEDPKKISKEDKLKILKAQKLPEWIYYSSSSEDEEEENKKVLTTAEIAAIAGKFVDDDEKKKRAIARATALKKLKKANSFMDAITSEIVVDGLMMLIYKVDYPSGLSNDKELKVASDKSVEWAKKELIAINNFHDNDFEEEERSKENQTSESKYPQSKFRRSKGGQSTSSASGDHKSQSHKTDSVRNSNSSKKTSSGGQATEQSTTKRRIKLSCPSNSHDENSTSKTTETPLPQQQTIASSASTNKRDKSGTTDHSERRLLKRIKDTLMHSTQ